jgi:hypothetical protein
VSIGVSYHPAKVARENNVQLYIEISYNPADINEAWKNACQWGMKPLWKWRK